MIWDEGFSRIGWEVNVGFGGWLARFEWWFGW